MLQHISKLFAPLLVTFAAMASSGCDTDISIGGEEGVPLAELDTAGPAPTGIALMGPDTIVVTEGETLSVTADGDQAAVDALRFALENGTLAVMRANDAPKDIGTATVRVAMPAPESIAMLGSGRIDVASMAPTADINIGGSGSVAIARIAVDTLDLNIGGAGTVTAGGTVGRLDLNVLGSGSAELDRVTVDTAEINVAGSGSTRFASDGTVEANIMGSGDVDVIGTADCTVNALGSGTLDCAPGE